MANEGTKERRKNGDFIAFDEHLADYKVLCTQPPLIFELFFL